MKKTILATALTLSLGAVAADSDSQVSTSKMSSNPFVEKPFEASAGVAVGRVTLTDDKQKRSATGLHLTGAKNFDINGELTTSTNIMLNYLGLSEKDETNGRVAELGVGQRLTYNREVAGNLMRVYGGVALSRGGLLMESTRDSDELSVGYWKYGVNVGSQYLLSNNLMPYVNFELSRIALDKKGDVKVDGRTYEGTLDKEDRSGSVAAMTVGMGFLF